MLPFLESATRFSFPAALLAFAIAAAIYWLARRQGDVPPAAGWGMIGLLILFGVAALAIYVRTFFPYHVRVSVTGGDGRPLETAKVWSITGGSAKKVPGGWVLDVPASARPADGKMLVWASIDARDLTHSRVVLLSQNHSPAVTIQIGAAKTAYVGGVVSNYDGDPVPGVWLTISGYPGESVVTQEDGRFALPANAATGEDVLLEVTAGRTSESHWEKAGDQSLTVRLAGVLNEGK